MTKVLIVATSPKTRGDITALLNTYQQGGQWEKYYCRWITTYLYKKRLRKVTTPLKRLTVYVFFFHGFNLYHIYVSMPTLGSDVYLKTA